MTWPSKQDWQVAAVVLNPRKLFVLWAIKVGFCNKVQDFQRHFGPGLRIKNLIANLAQQGFLKKEGDFLSLTQGGEQAASYLDLEDFSFVRRTGKKRNEGLLFPGHKKNVVTDARPDARKIAAKETDAHTFTAVNYLRQGRKKRKGKTLRKAWA